MILDEINHTVTLRQQERFRSAARDLVLPAFMINDRDEWRLVHYESDILSRVPWNEVDVSALSDLPLGEGRTDYEVRTGLETEALEPDAEDAGQKHGRQDGNIDYYFAASHLLDVMPNPWRGSEVARRVGETAERHDCRLTLAGGLRPRPSPVPTGAQRLRHPPDVANGNTPLVAAYTPLGDGGETCPVDDAA